MLPLRLDFIKSVQNDVGVWWFGVTALEFVSSVIYTSMLISSTSKQSLNTHQEKNNDRIITATFQLKDGEIILVGWPSSPGNSSTDQSRKYEHSKSFGIITSASSNVV